MFHHLGTSDTPLPPFFSAPAASGALISSDIGGGGAGDGGGVGFQMYRPSPTSQSPPYSSSLPNSCHLLRTTSNLSGYTHTSEPFPQISFFSSSPSSSDLAGDFYNEPTVRRVFSTGDLQGMNAMQLPAENGGQEGFPGGAAARACRYSADERKERIERYRSKRNQRNFQKKITYACRKTLADSRPRVRGRFARNGETETEMEAAEETSCFYNNTSFYRSYNSYDQTPSSYTNCNFYADRAHNQQQQQEQAVYDDGGGSGGGESGGVDDWCRQMQAALATEVEEEEVRRWDEDTWAYLDVLTTDLLS